MATAAKGSAMKTGLKLTGVALIGVGTLDIVFGDTNSPMLPAPLANVLNQQTDIILIALGGVLVFMKF